MPPKNTHNAKPLKHIRESLGFTLEEVAAHCNMPPNHLRDLETIHDDIDDHDAALLSDAYGIDVLDALDDRPDALPPTPLRVLLKAQADVLDAGTRFAISEAVAVSVDTRRIQELLNEREDHPSLFKKFRTNTDYSHPDQGMPEKLAAQVREQVRLDDDPIPSMVTLVQGLGIQIVVADLAPEIDAVGFAASQTGGVIVLNRSGKHAANAFGRRVTLAHELCHLLFDRTQMRGINKFCAVSRDRRRTTTKAPSRFEEIERRARAFALYLLVPIGALDRLWRRTEGHAAHHRARLVMEQFGIGYEAARAHLQNAGLLSLQEEISLVDTEPPLAWEARDALPIHASSHLDRVPLNRRGIYLDLVARAWRQGALTESGARDALRVTRAAWPPVAAYLTAPHSLIAPACTDWESSAARLGLPRP